MSRIDLSLHLVTDRELAGERSLEEIVRAAIAGGVGVVQLREKQASTREFLDRARLVRRLTRETETTMIVNDRLDIALAVEADGLHVGRGDLPPDVARRLLGPRRLLGVSVRDPQQLQAARDGEADYIGCGAAFATSTKGDTGPPIGLEGLRGMVERSELPVVAIGGIQASNAGAVMETGVAGIAVVSAIVSASDPEGAARRLAEIVGRPR